MWQSKVPTTLREHLIFGVLTSPLIISIQAISFYTDTKVSEKTTNMLSDSNCFWSGFQFSLEMIGSQLSDSQSGGLSRLCEQSWMQWCFISTIVSNIYFYIHLINSPHSWGNEFLKLELQAAFHEIKPLFYNPVSEISKTINITLILKFCIYYVNR